MLAARARALRNFGLAAEEQTRALRCHLGDVRSSFSMITAFPFAVTPKRNGR